MERFYLVKLKTNWKEYQDYIDASFIEENTFEAYFKDSINSNYIFSTLDEEIIIVPLNLIDFMAPEQK